MFSDCYRWTSVNERWRDAIRFEFHAFRWAHRARRVEVASKRTAAKRLTWRRAAKVSPKLSAVADMCVAVKCIPCAKRQKSVQFQPQHRRRARVIEVITWVDCPFHTEIVNFSQIFARLSRNIRILYALNWFLPYMSYFTRQSLSSFLLSAKNLDHHRSTAETSRQHSESCCESTSKYIMSANNPNVILKSNFHNNCKQQPTLVDNEAANKYPIYEHRWKMLQNIKSLAASGNLSSLGGKQEHQQEKEVDEISTTSTKTNTNFTGECIIIFILDFLTTK